MVGHPEREGRDDRCNKVLAEIASCVVNCENFGAFTGN